jgi:hypothetical protein
MNVAVPNNIHHPSIALKQVLNSVFDNVKCFVRRQKPITSIFGQKSKPCINSIEIDITYRCNLKCNNCNRSLGYAPTKDQMRLAQINKFVSESVAMQARWESIRLIGGEPTLHPDLLHIINILMEYKEKYSSDLSITLVTNGSGDLVKKVLHNIPKTISIKDSMKYLGEYEHIVFPDAPSDHLWNAFVSYSNGCGVLDMGMGLSPYGYYFCPVAGAIDRVFGFDKGRKMLPSNNDLMMDQRLVFCNLCGHFFGNKRFSKTTMSRSWQKAYRQYHVRKPNLTLY